MHYLVLIQAIEVLPRLFDEVHVPTQVMEELEHSRTPARVKQWVGSPPPWLHVNTPSTSLPASVHLDPGEAQAIALAKELGADAVLIDERKGRRIAQEHGLLAVGTLAVLELAAERKLLELKPALQALSATTFYISESYLQDALRRDETRKHAEGDRSDRQT
ncbi:MAG: DUF3368 domain-containing protein [Phycisphaeraceae bacterium]